MEEYCRNPELHANRWCGCHLMPQSMSLYPHSNSVGPKVNHPPVDWAFGSINSFSIVRRGDSTCCKPAPAQDEGRTWPSGRALNPGRAGELWLQVGHLPSMLSQPSHPTSLHFCHSEQQVIETKLTCVLQFIK